jgi:hypothetical protein
MYSGMIRLNLTSKQNQSGNLLVKVLKKQFQFKNLSREVSFYILKLIITLYQENNSTQN